MARSRGRQDTSQRRENNPGSTNRQGGFEQTGSGYRYDDEQNRGRDRWQQQPSQQSGYSGNRNWASDYGRDSQSGRGYEGSSQENSQRGTGGRGDWDQERSWNRGRDYEDYEPRYGRGSEDYGSEQDRYGGSQGGYEPGDYSFSNRGAGGYGSGQDWTSGSRGSYGKGSQQGTYGEGPSRQSWGGSSQGNRGITQGNFGEGSQQNRSFAGRGPQGYKRSDERIAEDVNEALTRDHALDATNIQVEVQNGEVTLKGSVSDRDAKRRAEDIAESCSGVKDVQNQLRVKREDESGSESSSENSRREKGDDKRHRAAS